MVPASLAISSRRAQRSGNACLATCWCDRDALEKHHTDALAAIGIEPHGRLQRAEDCAIRISRYQPDDPKRKITKIPKAAADIGRT